MYVYIHTYVYIIRIHTHILYRGLSALGYFRFRSPWSRGLVFGLFGHQHRLFVGEVVQHRQEADEISGASDAFLAGLTGQPVVQLGSWEAGKTRTGHNVGIVEDHPFKGPPWPMDVHGVPTT